MIFVAARVLGSSTVAGTNAGSLAKHGLDARRIDDLIPAFGVAVTVGDFVLKKVEPDPETPDNFGLFVRRVAASSGVGRE